MISITIDGLSATGKSTLAKKISEHYDFKNFNTGAIYRCCALTILRKKLDIQDIENILKYLKDMQIDFRNGKVFLQDEDVTKTIRSEEISILSTEWASIPELKAFVRNYQMYFLQNNNTVMEGRDIGTRIAPNATVKFYLYADFLKRVERKWKENPIIDKNEIQSNLEKVDKLEITNKDFIKPMNAFEIDTTNYTIEEIYKQMVSIIDEKLEQIKKEKEKNENDGIFRCIK